MKYPLVSSYYYLRILLPPSHLNHLHRFLHPTFAKFFQYLSSFVKNYLKSTHHKRYLLLSQKALQHWTFYEALYNHRNHVPWKSYFSWDFKTLWYIKLVLISWPHKPISFQVLTVFGLIGLLYGLFQSLVFITSLRQLSFNFSLVLNYLLMGYLKPPLFLDLSCLHMKLMRLPELFELFLKEAFEFFLQVLLQYQIIFLGFNQILILFTRLYFNYFLFFNMWFVMFIV